jgi:uroporphyrinogen decarboxylase
MIEGGGSRDFQQVKKMLYGRPDLLHRILDTTAKAVVLYLNAQIRRGAQAVMVFDTWGGILSNAAFRTFSLRYLKQVVDGLHKEIDGVRVPSIVFTKGGGLWLESLAGCGADALGLDWSVDIGCARARVGGQVALQGNLDPSVLLTDPETVRHEAKQVLEDYGQGTGHVFNLGHGVSQFTPPENVAALVETVHEVSVRYH